MKNKLIYVVCTGPSLTGFDFEQLREYDTMVVNHAYKYVPDWNYLSAIDDIIYLEYDKTLDKSNVSNRFAITAFREVSKIPNFLQASDVKIPIVKLHRDRPQLDERLFFINTFGNSGYISLEFAIKLGYTDIRLLGMDLTISGHFYGGPNFEYLRVPPALIALETIVETKFPEVTISRYDLGEWEAFNKNKFSLSEAFLPLEKLKNYE